MKILNMFSFLVMMLIVLACDDDGIDVNLGSFTAITDPLPYQDLSPDSDPTYWELNHRRNHEVNVLVSSGTKCEGAGDPEQCAADFELAAMPDGGFAGGCLPSHCYYFIRYQKNDETFVVAFRSELKELLGTIDSKADAIHTKDPIFEVPIFGDDGALREEGTIRVTDMAFAEQVLLDQDAYISEILRRPEFQKKMTGTEMRYLRGAITASTRRR